MSHYKPSYTLNRPVERSKHTIFRLFILLALVVGFVFWFVGSVQAPSTITVSKEIQSSLTSYPAGTKQKQAITTVFWVGEPAGHDNGGIANSSSAWDELWQQHYGGVDAPDHRSGYNPVGFVPKENPFYIALPYNDFDSQGYRKPSANLCSNTTLTSSWCKNSWVRIVKDGKAVYAQWEDVGPFYEDDIQYVFGSNTVPQNRKGEKAGLDVSPAVQTYLGLKDVDTTIWSFVKQSDVPDGPWLTVVTKNT